MAKLEDLKRGARITGILPGVTVTVIDVRWHGSDVVELTYKDETGALGNQLLYRDNEPALQVKQPGQTWAFDGDAALLRLVSEAHRIRLAHLFDPLFAIHTSLVEPLPHQITAVYEEMLPRQPLRFLLADDPGSGKTIMAGLLMRELIIRGDLKRCLICCPGNLATQWQDELLQRFNLQFDIISSATIEESAFGNPYLEKPLVISRLDHMSRNERIQKMLQQTEWDLVVIDEAHKLSAHYYGYEIKETMRYKLGRLLGSPERTRHLLFLTATPHSGKEEDFQLFMALLDADRFEGRFRDGVHVTDTRDLMRRLVKEQLVKFDGTPLFPERRAYTVKYELSPAEAQLYAHVTDYVRNEMNRADRLAAEGAGRRGNRVGFALTTLQRRLASSPEAIYKSLQRRRERLEKRLREEKLLRRGRNAEIEEPDGLPDIDEERLEDLEDAPDDEVEKIEDAIVEQASAARTIAELEAEIATLKTLEAEAKQLRQQGTDRKWEELSRLLQDRAQMFDARGLRRKLIIFSEHRDTITYLVSRIQSLLGRPEEVVVIHGGLGREERRKIQELFTQDKDVHILVATDAAGEGINLQRAHLLVNYNLPWNPSRVEQRIGRVDRIGQEQEVVKVVNLLLRDSVDERVYSLLRHRCGLFEHFVGPMQRVLAAARDVLLGRISLDAAGIEKAAEEVNADTLIQESYRAEEAVAVQTKAPVSRADISYAISVLAKNLPVVAFPEGSSFRLEFHKPRRRGQRLVRASLDPVALRKDTSLLPLVPDSELAHNIAATLAKESELLPLVIGTRTAEDNRYRRSVALWLDSDDGVEIENFQQLRTLVEGWDGSRPTPQRCKQAEQKANKLANAAITAAVEQANRIEKTGREAQVAAARLRLLQELGRFLASLTGNTTDLDGTFYKYMSGRDPTALRLRRAFELLGNRYPEWPEIIKEDLAEFCRTLSEDRRTALRAGSELDAAMADPRWATASHK